MILVDTGSTDGTTDIALRCGASVFQYDWDNNFSNAKNFALDKAKGDWIIFLDADEYLESNTQKSLKAVLNHVSPNKEFDAVLCRMINTDGFNGRELAENPIIRVLRGNRAIRYAGAVHEQPLKNGKPLKAARISDVNLIIYHTGYAVSVMPEKLQRNLKLLNEQVIKNNIDNLTYYYMSSIHNSLKNYEEAIKYALLSLKEPKLKDTIVSYHPYVFLVQSMLALSGKYTDEVIDRYVNEALNLYPGHPEIWYIRALSKKAQKDYPAAIESYLKAIECQKSFDHSMNNNFPARLEDVYYDLASLSNNAGNSLKALEYYFEGLKINKYNIDILTGLYKLIKDQKPEEILFFLNSIYNKEDKNDLVFLNNAMNGLDNQVAAAYYYSLYEAKFGAAAK
jgi:glycosyltransferase involved in cell wall biosynthesis